MNLRTYNEKDAKEILNWVKNEREFRLWTSDIYKDYPISEKNMNKNYIECEKSSNFYPLTLEDKGKVIGHLILKKSDENPNIVRIGFIIVDNSIRGKGYGKKLIEEAIKYAREKLNAEEINLGVFMNNEEALNCYKSMGFKLAYIEKRAFDFHDEKWDCGEMFFKK